MKTKVGQQIKIGHLNELYAIFNLVQQRRYQRFQYALSQLNTSHLIYYKQHLNQYIVDMYAKVEMCNSIKS
ncbi:MAG: hypothetical protein ACTS8P_06145 [Arsenophonus sp. NC-XBC3-MAG3]